MPLRRIALALVATLTLALAGCTIPPYTNSYRSSRIAEGTKVLSLPGGASTFRDLFITNLLDKHQGFTFNYNEADVAIDVFGDITYSKQCFINWPVRLFCGPILVSGTVLVSGYDKKSGEFVYTLVKSYAPTPVDAVVADLQSDIKKGLAL